MYLKKLTLSNVGVFSGEASFCFSVDPEQPVTLIGGENGSGKTTILTSVLLALYGKRSINFFGFKSYKQYLADLIHRGENEANITLVFERQELGENREYRLKRQWELRGDGQAEEELEVFINGEADKGATENWSEYVEQILPESLAGLFIFDGEKIEALAHSETSTEALRTSLYALLGLDLVERLKRDLTEYKRRLVLEAQRDDSEEKMSEILKHQIAEAESNMEFSKELLISAKEELDTSQKESENSSERLSKVNDEFSKAGGDLFLQREETSRKLAQAEMVLEDNHGNLLDLGAGRLPILLNMRLLERIRLVGQETVRAEESEILLRHYKQRDEEFLMTLREQRSPLEAGEGEENLWFDSSQIEFVEKILTNDRSEHELSYSPPFEVPQEVSQLTEDLLGPGRDSLLESLSNAIETSEGIQKEIESYKSALSQTPNAEELVPLVEKVKKEEARFHESAKTFEEKKINLASAENILETAERKFENLANQAFALEAVSVRSTRINREIEKARITLKNFEKRIVEKNISRIKSGILEALFALNRKKTLVSDISVNPETLTIELKDSTGAFLKSERLSAGERQLFATSLLWGLSKATTQKLPTIVDTPVARLDSTHRKQLVENYFPQAAHQVILLSTNEEIVGEYYKALSSFIGKEYLISFDEEKQKTKVSEGYFS